MRARERSLIDPLTGHGRKAREAYGVKGPREQDDDIRVSLEWLSNVPATVRPRLTGSHLDGTASREIARVLATLGIAVDETDDDPDPTPRPYENNQGILFRGTAPSVAIGGATIVGTGGSRSISLADANDNSGRILLTTGNAPAPSAAGTFATITFVRPKSNADFGVVVYPVDADSTARPAYSIPTGRTTTAFTVAAASTLGSGVSYQWEYLVIEREQL